MEDEEGGQEQKPKLMAYVKVMETYCFISLLKMQSKRNSLNKGTFLYLKKDNAAPRSHELLTKHLSAKCGIPLYELLIKKSSGPPPNNPGY